jgi:hypothetical protein
MPDAGRGSLEDSGGWAPAFYPVTRSYAAGEPVPVRNLRIPRDDSPSSAPTTAVSAPRGTVGLLGPRPAPVRLLSDPRGSAGQTAGPEPGCDRERSVGAARARPGPLTVGPYHRAALETRQLRPGPTGPCSDPSMVFVERKPTNPQVRPFRGQYHVSSGVNGGCSTPTLPHPRTIVRSPAHRHTLYVMK